MEIFSRRTGRWLGTMGLGLVGLAAVISLESLMSGEMPAIDATLYLVIGAAVVTAISGGLIRAARVAQLAAAAGLVVFGVANLFNLPDVASQFRLLQTIGDFATYANLLVTPIAASALCFRGAYILSRVNSRPSVVTARLIGLMLVVVAGSSLVITVSQLSAMGSVGASFKVSTTAIYLCGTYPIAVWCGVTAIAGICMIAVPRKALPRIVGAVGVIVCVGPVLALADLFHGASSLGEMTALAAIFAIPMFLVTWYVSEVRRLAATA